MKITLDIGRGEIRGIVSDVTDGLYALFDDPAIQDLAMSAFNAAVAHAQQDPFVPAQPEAPASVPPPDWYRPDILAAGAQEPDRENFYRVLAEEYAAIFDEHVKRFDILYFMRLYGVDVTEAAFAHWLSEDRSTTVTERLRVALVAAGADIPLIDATIKAMAPELGYLAAVLNGQFP